MFLLLLFLSVFARTFASDRSISDNQMVSYYQATLNDVPPLIAVVKAIGKDKGNESDLEKVVKLPDRFIEAFLKQDIINQKIYIAFDHCNNRIVGYKKLFAIGNAKELQDIMRNEVRCMGDKSFLVDFAMIKSSDTFFERTPINEHVPFIPSSSDLYVYTGADYVIPASRNQGIIKNLYAYSLSRLFETFIKNGMDNYNRIVFLYGLSQYNDFRMQGEGKSRTSSIVRSVVSVLLKMNISFNSAIQHFRYQACMPIFIDNGQDCALLSDEQSVAGFGNVVTFTFKKD